MDELDELRRRCGLYAFIAGKQLGGLIALREAAEHMTIDEVKEKLSELISETTSGVDQMFYGNVSRD